MTAVVGSQESALSVDEERDIKTTPNAKVNKGYLPTWAVNWKSVLRSIVAGVS